MCCVAGVLLCCRPGLVPLLEAAETRVVVQLRRNAAAARVALLTSVVMSFLELERTPRSFDFYSLRTCKRLHLDAVLQPISIGVWKGVAGTEIESSPIF